MIADLPSISFTDTDAGNIEASIITMYESISGRTLAQGDPVRLFLQSVAAIIIQQRILIDYSAKMNLLAYSEDDYLDHIGILVGVTRLVASAATTTLRFTLSAVQPQAVTIPAGIRATTPNGVVFQVTMATDIPAGSLYADAPAECMVTGTSGNGYVSGQVNQFVDPLPWIQSVVNTTETAGGSDIESDDSFRSRIQQAPESFSVAGPDGAYIFWAKTASGLIVDVSVRSPAPGEVEIRPLLVGGELPGPEIIEAVYDICSDKKIRPLTDKLTVLEPEVISYDISLTYYINRDNATTSLAIQSAVNQAVIDYVTWQKSKLGRVINPTELIYRMRSAGGSRVEVAAPVYALIETYQVAIAGSVLVNFGGLVDGD
ncbi:MAG TPA: baseplate J/gp47 family protein [Methylomusa anaerophila]|uniref:Baseplate J-like protein n=1 Tax=Methylomusa anaerophila TaxID=1930071 RepID=A0A348AJ16_9FIRM|nr:baseplate J/gp47 family protein [Methylomusa anaerophila]BBB91064.1 baseplate J-like protein [Methylomusa anaerophila]HML88939.1 baseplate J/gp47 family protein [Methylomusa anaerophila]